jgi:hypothetical protein
MSFGRANGRTPIRPTWVNSNDCFEYRSKQHGQYAFAHPAEGDPTFGRDPTDAFYEGVHMRKWHGQQSVSGQDVGIGRHHPPYLCAVTSPHAFATALLVTVKPHRVEDGVHGESVPCLLLPHSVLRGLEHDFELLRDALDVVTRVVPPSTHSAPKKDEFYLTKLTLDPWRFFEFSPAPDFRRGETHDENHMDYAVVAVDSSSLAPEIPREWLRSLEDAAAFGYHPAPNAHNLLGVAPKRWLDPAYVAVGKNAVGINWRRGRVEPSSQTSTPPIETPSQDSSNESSGVTSQNTLTNQRRLGVGFQSVFEGLPPAPTCSGGAVLACMMDESARAAGVRNSMAADTRFAASVRPFATPPIGYGDWGVLVGMHRGSSRRFSDKRSASDEASDVLRITDVVADLARRRNENENENENENANERVSSRGDATEDDAVAAPASPPAPERRVSWRVGGETLEDAALRKRRQWVEGMTIER